MGDPSGSGIISSGGYNVNTYNSYSDLSDDLEEEMPCAVLGMLSRAHIWRNHVMT